MNTGADTELPLHSFDAKGMNTVFTLRIHHPDKETARRHAGNCFRLLEELEAELSRYRPDSEISRINLLETGQSMFLADATYRCLRRALHATEATAGLFDVTLGARTWREKESSEFAPLKGILKLSPDRPQIICEEAGRQIDLGGIGKGFALEEMAKELRNLGVESALLSCGASTHLAAGARPWSFSLRGDAGSIKIQLTGGALSSSGTGEQGAHVVHPDTGAPPGYAFKRVWVIARSASLADAFSTACLLMDGEEIVSFAQAMKPKKISVYAEDAGDGIVRRIE
jgi:thiamine biosynthesis lipoprotein